MSVSSATPAPPVGVLLLQLGTPDAPTSRALRRFLRPFLGDRRVIELPRALWLPILYLFVLTLRPRASARKYARIWSHETGSPLRHYTVRQEELLAKELGPGFVVAHGMRYGRPPAVHAIELLLARGCDRIVAFPLFPQYAASSTGSALDDLFAALPRRRFVPAVHVVPPFFDDPLYLAALEARAREHAAANRGERAFDHTVISFHGLPVSMVEKGDPYPGQCVTTAQRLAQRLGFAAGSWSLTFQSRFGRGRWLEPATEGRLVELARAGARRVRILMPGFVVDCLETLDELGHEAEHAFRRAGGETLSLVPCLNDHPAWIEAMAAIVRREAAPWAARRESASDEAGVAGR